ncbi:MAG: hypothetical protein M0Z60_13150 [Nitrospiraceae bacterium]|nr:hypothetical protein [Nitrospiraceae bacterium]
MKTATFVTLLALFVSILVPLSVTLVPSSSYAFMIADDVCDSMGGAFSTDTDHPLLQPGRCTVCCPCCAGFAESQGLVCRQFVMPAVKDHPPER